MEIIKIEDAEQLKQSLEVVLELAEKSALNAEDASVKNYEPLQKQALQQLFSIKVVSDFIEFLKTI